VHLVLELKEQLVVQCHDCGFVFMNENPTHEEIERCYSTYSYSIAVNAPAATIASFNKLLQELEPFRKTNRILDYGCGQGWFIEEAKKRGWEVWGTEYSEAAIKLGKEKDISILSLEDAKKFEQGFFDVVVMIEVIEHVTDIHEPFRSIHKWLRQGGLLYCTTPNFNAINRYIQKKEKFRIISWPEHLSYFTRKTLGKLASMNGFSKKKILTTGLSFSVKKTTVVNSSGAETATNRDEQIRDSIQKNKILQIIKAVVNSVLSVTGLGITLKGYFIKK
jgi:2-polyprenyl-3-methyl-5-hydroxy-6-metoxy-1,4-benzoquinol methylase